MLQRHYSSREVHRVSIVSIFISLRPRLTAAGITRTSCAAMRSALRSRAAQLSFTAPTIHESRVCEW
ncbi:hypothetical protein CPLU01_05791 [Colletotrichum plurivorum]|uniref:Uncharacterized protein n=1 Tax=Colletotrichum plurivorum TaxID=2175906 RepID=A0A8H6KKC8_9PEZI|nr:hypothetical protein CPLU01_05791 [Colletotrichum plurivorum]